MSLCVLPSAPACATGRLSASRCCWSDRCFPFQSSHSMCTCLGRVNWRVCGRSRELQYEIGPLFLQVYWIYWGVLFSTLVTWALAVAAAAGEAWIVSVGFVDFVFSSDCEFTHDEFSTSCDICELTAVSCARLDYCLTNPCSGCVYVCVCVFSRCSSR